MEIKIVNNLLEEIEGISHDYPYVMHHVDLQTLSIPWHWHEEVEFVYVISGTMEVTTTNRTYTFHEHEAFFINTNTLCTMKSLSGEQPCMIDSHLFHPVFLGGHYKSIFETKYLEPVLKNTKIELVEFKENNELHNQIKKRLVYISSFSNKENKEFQVRNEFSEIWLLLIEVIKDLEKRGIGVKPASQERILTMLTFIHQHYPEKLSLNDIASAALVSKRECLRCFQTCIHKTPFEYLMEYRIQAAQLLLRTTNTPITSIAMQTGFSNSAYFSKIFKETTHMTPNDYRNKHQY